MTICEYVCNALIKPLPLFHDPISLSHSGNCLNLPKFTHIRFMFKTALQYPPIPWENGGFVAVVGHDANRTRRVLRPRTEPRSYAESPDIVLLPAKINGRQQNGNIDSETDDDDDDDEEMPPIYPIKELTPAELWERERGLRKLREELRNEETKLVLLKKLKQSQQMMKENLIVTPTNLPNANNPLAAIPAALTKGTLSVTTTTAIPLPAHNKNRSAILR